MTVATFKQPDYINQLGTSYPAAIDASFAVAARAVDMFAAHEQSTPAMTVRLDAGFTFDGATLAEVAAQSTGTITAPVGNPRIDRVVVDRATGAVSVVTGTPAGSPAAPAIPAGKLPVARVLLQTSSTVITNAMITDERMVWVAGLSAAAFTAMGTAANQLVQLDGSAKLPAVPGDALTSTMLKNMPRNVQTGSSYTTVATDTGKCVVGNNATAITIALIAAASGGVMAIVNSGAGALTIDPDGSETIAGATTLTIPQNGGVLINPASGGWEVVASYNLSSGALTGEIRDWAPRALPDSTWLWCDGTAVSRATYAALYNALCPSLGTFTVTIASPAVFTLNSHNLNVGDRVRLTTTGALPTGLSTGTDYFVIAAGLTANAFEVSTTLNGSAVNTSGSQSGTHTAQFTGWGLGDGSTTFNIPDLRGRATAGRDNMGGTAASRLTSAGSGIQATAIGQAGGTETHTLTTPQSAAHTHSQSIGAADKDPAGAGGTIFTAGSTATGSTGGGGAHQNTQPTAIINKIIKT